MSELSFKSLQIDKINGGYRITNDSKYYVFLGYLPNGARKIREFCMIAPKEFSVIEHELDIENLIIQIKNFNYLKPKTWISSDEILENDS